MPGTAVRQANSAQQWRRALRFSKEQPVRARWTAQAPRPAGRCAPPAIGTTLPQLLTS